MSITTHLIGVDTSLEQYLGTDGAPTDANVHVAAHNGQVSICGPFASWAGYKVLADFDSDEEGEALARRIAADPVAELSALGYDLEGWFRPAAQA